METYQCPEREGGGDSRRKLAVSAAIINKCAAHVSAHGGALNWFGTGGGAGFVWIFWGSTRSWKLIYCGVNRSLAPQAGYFRISGEDRAVEGGGGPADSAEKIKSGGFSRYIT